MRPILFVLAVLCCCSLVAQELPQPNPPILWSVGTDMTMHRDTDPRLYDADTDPFAFPDDELLLLDSLAPVETVTNPEPTWSWWEQLENVFIQTIWDLSIP